MPTVEALSDGTDGSRPRGVGRIKAWLDRLIRSDHIFWGMGIASFLESTLVPIPLETILLPLMQRRRQQLWWLALVVLLGCLLGAVVGYAVGYFVFDAIGQWVIGTFGSEEQFDSVRRRMEENGFWFVFSVGVTPIPFQLAMVSAGAMKFSLGMFLLASALARGIRYFGLAALVYFFGDQVEALYRKHKVVVGLGLLVVVVVFWIL